MSKLQLEDFTLCAAASTDLPLTARALAISAEKCTYGDVVFFTHESISGPFRVESIGKLSGRDNYSRFMVKELPRLINTPYILVVQWDGYVIDPSAWRPEFREFDYIGARWHWYKDPMTVGNGGFSLRSRRLLQGLALPEFLVPEGMIEDEYICRQARPALERHGIRFAPDAVANLFSYEYTEPENPTFGFHGLFNMWRHTEDAEMAVIVRKIPKFRIRSENFARLFVHYYALRKFDILAVMYERIREEFDPVNLAKHLSKWVLIPKMVSDCIAACERLKIPMQQRSSEP